MAKAKRKSKITRFLALVPHTWLDPLLTGPKAVIGSPPYDCRDIQRLLLAITHRISVAETEGKQT